MSADRKENVGEGDQTAPMSRERLISLCLEHLPQILQERMGDFRGRIHCDVMLAPGSSDNYCLRIALPEHRNFSILQEPAEVEGIKIAILAEGGQWTEKPQGTRIIHGEMPKLA